MALSSVTGLAAYNIAPAVKKLDLSEELAEIIRTDNTVLLQRVGAAGCVATQLTHKWPEDKLNPNTATANESTTFSTTDTTLTVASGHATRFRIGTIFKDNTAGKSEIMRVTAISGNDLTVERGKGMGFTAGTGEEHAANFPIIIIAHTKQEDWKPSQEDWSQERSGAYNFISTMGYGIKIGRAHV